MKYSEQQLDDAVSQTGLSPHHQNSLRELLSRNRKPLFLGYIVYALGFACLILFGFFIYLVVLAYVHDLEIDESQGLKAAGFFFVFALFLMSGAQTFLNRIRASRAVAELLVK